MTLSRRRLVCPLLIDIGSSGTITLPYFYHTVCPCLYEELHKLLKYRYEQQGYYSQKQSFPQIYRENLNHTFIKTLLRPCGFSQERPLLQHESWKVAWQTYLNAVSQRGQVSAPGLAPISSHLHNNNNSTTTERKNNNEPDAYDPLLGTLSLPIPVSIPISKDSINEETTTTTMMEFFRVDAFIPIHVQMYHVMRRVMNPLEMWDIIAIGIVVPTHQTDYFVKAVRNMQESIIDQSSSKQTLPNILLYDSKGLQFRL
ncbi:uncharacterized protein TM35_000122510 [Trypanosoma theileri]|uniref:Uncharacterized protein n=1 Tax=Trypanosoma theileri TaxID=67003 RepID=A0A1X0NXP9_9TRYP|nr:uncharacterized protein TM35_000122510 [Trypanosoma theileri]ORC89476.1 hypothetical protein TM35_000122510 [Trypanosoma theileri]